MMPSSRDQSIELPIPSREAAGQVLGRELAPYGNRSDTLILALPRGGVPVGFEVAKLLHAPLDIMAVRKLGTPGRSELAMGAIAGERTRVLNDAVINFYQVSDQELAEVEAVERREITRRDLLYRGHRRPALLEGRVVVLVDDGLATGATMRAAISEAREQRAAKVIVAVPIAPEETLERLRSEADQVYCLATPRPFHAIGGWYRRFDQVDDAQVRALLEEALQNEPAAQEAAQQL